MTAVSFSATGDFNNINSLKLINQTAPTPGAGTGYLYKKTGDSNLYWKANGGAETGIGTGRMVGTSTATNTIAGLNAGQYITSATGTLGIGYQALAALISGNNNTAVGHNVLAAVTSANNTAVGTTIGTALTTGSDNILLGTNITTAASLSRNTIIGQNISSSANNSVILGRTITASSTGINNVLIGRGFSLTGTFGKCVAINITGHNITGDYAVAIRGTTGKKAVCLSSGVTGDYSVSIGSNDANVTRAVSIQSSTATGNNSVSIKGADGGFANSISLNTSATAANGLFVPRSATTGTVMVFNATTGQLGPQTSTQRHKQNIRDAPDLTVNQNNIKIREYERKDNVSINTNNNTELGIIAEELNVDYPLLVQKDSDGKPFSLSYDRLSLIIIQELQAMDVDVKMLQEQFNNIISVH